LICREKVEGDHKIIPRRLLYLTGDEMKIDDRLKNMSKEQLISLIKEIKITCESNRGGTLNFILRLIKGEL